MNNNQPTKKHKSSSPESPPNVSKAISADSEGQLQLNLNDESPPTPNNDIDTFAFAGVGTVQRGETVRPALYDYDGEDEVVPPRGGINTRMTFGSIHDDNDGRSTNAAAATASTSRIHTRSQSSTSSNITNAVDNAASSNIHPSVIVPVAAPSVAVSSSLGQVPQNNNNNNNMSNNDNAPAQAQRPRSHTPHGRLPRTQINPEEGNMILPPLPALGAAAGGAEVDVSTGGNPPAVLHNPIAVEGPPAVNNPPAGGQGGLDAMIAAVNNGQDVIDANPGAVLAQACYLPFGSIVTSNNPNQMTFVCFSIPTITNDGEMVRVVGLENVVRYVQTHHGDTATDRINFCPLYKEWAGNGLAGVTYGTRIGFDGCYVCPYSRHLVIFDRYGKSFRNFHEACLGENRAAGAPDYRTVKDEGHVASLTHAVNLGFPLGTTVYNTTDKRNITVVLPDGHVVSGKTAVMDAAVRANIILDNSVIRNVFTAFENCASIPRSIRKGERGKRIWQYLVDWSSLATNNVATYTCASTTHRAKVVVGATNWSKIEHLITLTAFVRSREVREELTTVLEIEDEALHNAVASIELGGTPVVYELPPGYEIPAPVAWGDESGDASDNNAGQDESDNEAGSYDDADVEADNEGTNNVRFDPSWAQTTQKYQGYKIYKEGSKGDSVYFLNSGTVEVSTKSGFKTTLSQGALFGEGALFDSKGRRNATIRCVTPVHVIRISKEYFIKYMNVGDSETSLTLKEQDRARDRDRALKILSIQKNLVERDYFQGDTLFAWGEEGKSLFVVESGVIEIKGETGRHVLNVREGSVCGEHSVVTGQPRNCTAICISDKCKVYEMSARDFNKLSNSSPSMKQSFREIAFRRDLQKAVTKKFGNDFSNNVEDLHKAFDMVDLDKDGVLNLDDIKSLIRSIYPSLSDDDPIFAEVLQTLDIDGNNSIEREEFVKIFRVEE